MQLVIDSNICRENGISIEEFMLMYCIQHNTLNMDTLQPQLRNGTVILLGNRSPIEMKNLRLTKKGEQLLSIIEGKSIISNVPIVSQPRLEVLATKMCEIFPKGKMPNTKYSWQGTPALIVIRLKTFIKKFGDFTDEQYLDATRRYVRDYAKQNYQYMQLLKYFIWKDDDTKGFDSQLLNYITHPEMGTEDTDVGNGTLI